MLSIILLIIVPILLCWIDVTPRTILTITGCIALFSSHFIVFGLCLGMYLLTDVPKVKV